MLMGTPERCAVERFPCCRVSRIGVQWSDFPVAEYPGKVCSGVFIGGKRPWRSRRSIAPTGKSLRRFHWGGNAHGSRGVGYTYTENAWVAIVVFADRILESIAMPCKQGMTQDNRMEGWGKEVEGPVGVTYSDTL